MAELRACRSHARYERRLAVNEGAESALKILVTGGTGFVGPHVVHALRAEGHDVRALVRNPGSKAARRLVSWGCEIAQGEMTDAASLARAVAGCDTVVHLVAILVQSWDRTKRVMEQGTSDLLGASKEAGVRRFVLMSANGTHERSKDLTPYFHAKWEQERMVERAGLEWIAFRPSYVFGRDGGPLPLLVRQVRWAPVITTIGGDVRMQPIWVDDVAAFFAQAVGRSEALNRSFELAGPDVVSWNELYERIKRILGKRRPVVPMPIGLARAGAAVAERLPLSVPLSRDALTMLTYEDNVADPQPAIEAFGVTPIGLNEQIRRAVT
ncbi:MAG: NAD(P)H-binding protein [Actinomycetota bacterium]|nr:NAD(P)H-binding protein [Actinomycetota bacterium]